jgi:hypothetical protein
MYDTLLHRYSDMSFIMSLSVEEGIALYEKAIEKTIEHQVWERWLVDYSKMTKETFKSFKDYLSDVLKPPQPKDNRSDEEIINDADNILKSFKRSD